MEDAAPAPRKGRKHDQVLAGARQVFLSDGFEGASVDDIARAAGVSKATIYSYFADKRELFMAMARSECARHAEQSLQEIDGCAAPERVLGQAGRKLVGFILSDFGRKVFRTCMAEADRFPELGREFYEGGPKAGHGHLVAYMSEAVNRGELRIDDLDLAADQFAELCKAGLFPKLMFGICDSFSEAEIDRVIDGAVATFMARYGA